MWLFLFSKGGGEIRPFLAIFEWKRDISSGNYCNWRIFSGKTSWWQFEKKNQSFVKVVATDRKNGSKKGEVVLCLKKAGKFKKAARCFIWKKEIEDWRQDFLNNWEEVLVEGSSIQTFRRKFDRARQKWP